MLGLVVVAGGVIVTQGTVDEGSVGREGSATVFTITFNDVTMPVRYQGEPGGIFKECIPVVVHGEIQQGELQGDRVEVRHSDEYVSVNDERVQDAIDAACAGERG